MCNVVALLGVLVLSLRLVKPSLTRNCDLAAGSGAQPARLLLNPVLITIGFGQVNLFVTFLVMWDLLSERRIGKRQMPLGVATGLAAAVKLTPLLFVPYLLLTRRWRGALTCVITFGGVRAADFLDLTDFVEGLLDEGRLQARPCRRPFDRGQSEPLVGARSIRARRPPRIGRASAARPHCCRRTLGCGPGTPPVLTAVGRAHLCRDMPDCLPHLVGPSHGVGRASDPVVGLRTRPASLGTLARWRCSRSLLERSGVVGSLQEHLGSASRRVPTDCGQLVLSRHGALSGRRGGSRCPPAGGITPGRISPTWFARLTTAGRLGVVGGPGAGVRSLSGSPGLEQHAVVRALCKVGSNCSTWPAGRSPN